MVEEKILYTKPSITDLEISYASDAAQNGWGDECYKYITKFENLFKEHLGVKHAIATSSCTGAIHIGLSSLGIGPGDEVIIADINWIASVSPIVHVGAKPIFIDVDINSWCIDTKKLKDAITPNTKAIMAVHIYGNMCNMDELIDISKEYDIPIIEDSAEAIGSEWNSSKAGSMGSYGTFSFHGTKTICTGEGGMFVTNSNEIFEKSLTLSNHGRSRNQKKQFWPDMIGFKYKMSNIQAAIGCAQIERIDELVSKKRKIFNFYKDNLESLPFSFNPEPENTKNGYWMPTIIVDEDIEFDREDVLKKFNQNNIDARVFFWPLSSLPMFKEVKENINSYNLNMRGINLPSYHDLTEEQQERVIRVLKDIF
jgi:perosamine synthetase